MKLAIVVILLSACVADVQEADEVELTVSAAKVCNVWEDMFGLMRAIFPAQSIEGTLPPNTTCFESTNGRGGVEFTAFYDCWKNGNWYGFELHNPTFSGVQRMSRVEVTTWATTTDNPDFYNVWGAGNYVCSCTRNPHCQFWGLGLP